MPRQFWDGAGIMPDDAIYFTTVDGVIRGRPYLRARVARDLARWRDAISAEGRRRVLAATVDNDAWLAPQNGSLVSAVCREAIDHLLSNLTDYRDA